MTTDIPRPLQDAMRKADFLDPRAGNPSLNQWAKESGVHTSTISSFLDGRKTRPENVRKLAGALGIPVADLYAMVGRESLTPWVPPAGTEMLSERQRSALNELILAFMGDGSTAKAGDGDGEATPPTHAAGSAAHDDGLGAFDHRDRGDLDHESTNDGAGDNVYSLVPPPPRKDTAAYDAPNRGKKQKDKQDDDAEGSQDPEDDDE